MLTEKFDTKVLPRVRPPAYGGQATEGQNLGRIIRWTTEGFEWESNPKHYKDLAELCGLKEGPKGSDVPITKLFPVSCAVESFGAHMLECSVGKQSVVALSSAEAEFYAIVRGAAMGMQTLQIMEAFVRALSTTEVKDDDEN